MRSAVFFGATFLAATLCAVSVLVFSAGAAELVDVVKTVEPSVVRVDTNSGQGSGVVVSNDGLVVTNYHVIEVASEVTVLTREGKRYPASGYVVIEPTHDIAVLKVSGLPAGRAIRLASELPQVGEKVAAFGSPKGFSFSTSEGIVAAVRDGKDVQKAIGEAGYRSQGYSLDAIWIQTTAAISGGNSGGPL